MQNKRITISLLAVCAMGAMLLSISTGATGKSPRTRIIMMEPVEGIPFLLSQLQPRAMLSLLELGGQAGDDFRLEVVALFTQPVSSDSCYALYFTTRSSPAEYVHGEFGSGRFLFNTNFTGGISLWGLSVPPGFTVDAPILTVFIAIEVDDGFPFNPASDMNRLAFVGTSTR